SATRVAPARTRCARPGHRAALDLLIALRPILPPITRSRQANHSSHGTRGEVVPPPRDDRARGAPTCHYAPSGPGRWRLSSRGTGTGERPRLGIGPAGPSLDPDRRGRIPGAVPHFLDYKSPSPGDYS